MGFSKEKMPKCGCPNRKFLNAGKVETQFPDLKNQKSVEKNVVNLLKYLNICKYIIYTLYYKIQEIKDESFFRSTFDIRKKSNSGSSETWIFFTFLCIQ